MKRFVALVLLMVTAFIAVTPLASASESSVYSEVIQCPDCGGVCGVKKIMGDRSDSCAEGIHYYYREEFACYSCDYNGAIEGHYCTGKGGHFCLGGCNCKN